MAFDLSSITKGKHLKPIRAIFYGPHGIGKTTIAAQAPDPVFVPTEDGLGTIETSAFPLAETYEDVLTAITSLYREKHNFSTVVIDSLDWLESLIWSYTAKKGGHESIEGYGYGKGYIIAADCFREVLGGLNALRLERNMAIIMTAHCHVKRFDDPTCEPYDRYMLKLHKSASAIVEEWADIVAFCSQEMIVQREDVGFGNQVKRGVKTGGRMMHLNRSPAYDAKNRFGMPDTLPMTWDDFMGALSTGAER